MKVLTRVAIALTVLAIALQGYAALAAEKTIRIGLQKSSTLAAVLRANGELEKSLKDLGFVVTWSEFTSGLPLLEALNVGAIDVSADVADTVPLFAQAAGANLTYIAEEAASPTAQPILVKPASNIATLADLKGKKIAVTKAAGSHYLLIAALKKAGLKFSDITPAYLTPADGRAALESGSVDAWVTWDPFVTSSVKAKTAQVLTDGAGLASYKRYYLTSSKFLSAEPKAVAKIYEKLRETGEWVKSNPKEAAKVLAPIWGLDEEVAETANSHRTYKVGPVVASALTEQQVIADAFLAEGVLPKAIKTSDFAIWEPQTKASANEK